MKSKLVPTLDLSQGIEVNLDAAAQEWLRRHHSPVGTNPLLEPACAGSMVSELHRSHGASFSYGGYLEDRSHLLRGTYLDETGGHLHLGIDINATEGTPVHAPYDAVVCDVFDDRGTPQGWGPRLILEPEDLSCPLLVLGHLTTSSFKRGDKVRAGEALAAIGAPPKNGGWFPHLHVQQIARSAVPEHQRDEFASLDGYGHARDIAALRERYPDPQWLLRG